MTEARLTLHVKVYSAADVFVDEDAYSVSAVNHTGPFDILPDHKNFITVLSPGDISVITPNKTFTLPINHGVMHVRHDSVTVYVDV